MAYATLNDTANSPFRRWFAAWVARRADKTRRFKLPQFVLTADLIPQHARKRRADRRAAEYLADLPDDLRADLGLDGGARMKPTAGHGSSQMYYDRIIGSADRV